MVLLVLVLVLLVVVLAWSYAVHVQRHYCGISRWIKALSSLNFVFIYFSKINYQQKKPIVVMSLEMVSSLRGCSYEGRLSRSAELHSTTRLDWRNKRIPKRFLRFDCLDYSILNRGKQPSFSFSLTNAGAVDSNQRWPFSERRRLDSFIKFPPVFLVSLPWPPPTAGKRNYGEQKQTLRPCPKRTWVLGQRTVDLLTVTLLASLGTVPNLKS